MLEAINAAQGQLPKNLPSQPTIRKINPADAPIMILAVQSDALPLTTVDDYAENILAQQLSQISGVAQVLVGGQQKPAIRVQIDPAKLASMGLTLEDVRNVLVNATVDSPKGSIDGAGQVLHGAWTTTSLPTRAVQQHRRRLPQRRAGAHPRHRPGDARPAEPRARRPGRTASAACCCWSSSSPAPTSSTRSSGSRRRCRRWRPAIPPSIHVSTVVDRTQTIRASVDDVEFTLMLSIALVVMVIFLFLRNVWATIIPSITVPVALVGTFAVMYLLGFSLDNLSLMALTIAVGFVVDDAIVMLENIYRHIEDGMKPMEAAIKGAGEIGFTIVSISLSLIAVFIPLLLMGGIVGRLFREFAMTVTSRCVVSAFVSLTLTPMMCSRFLRQRSRRRTAGSTASSRLASTA